MIYFRCPTCKREREHKKIVMKICVCQTKMEVIKND